MMRLLSHGAEANYSRGIAGLVGAEVNDTLCAHLLQNLRGGAPAASLSDAPRDCRATDRNSDTPNQARPAAMATTADAVAEGQPRIAANLMPKASSNPCPPEVG